uniref:Uncharacterized protein n=1 Tax=Ascaris lumbricoides TaxID=6252 RepID=A0A0M3HGR6_ASCLU
MRAQVVCRIRSALSTTEETMSIGAILQHSTLSSNRLLNTSLAQLCAFICEEMLLMLPL